MTKHHSTNMVISQGCPLDQVFRLLSGLWTTHIIWILGTNGPTRYGELRRLADGISSKVLTDRLRMLEAEGVLYRDVELTVPPKVTYALTDRGRKLNVGIHAFQQVANHWTRPSARP